MSSVVTDNYIDPYSNKQTVGSEGIPTDSTVVDPESHTTNFSLKARCRAIANRLLASTPNINELKQEFDNALEKAQSNTQNNNRNKLQINMEKFITERLNEICKKVFSEDPEGSISETSLQLLNRMKEIEEVFTFWRSNTSNPAEIWPNLSVKAKQIAQGALNCEYPYNFLFLGEKLREHPQLFYQSLREEMASSLKNDFRSHSPTTRNQLCEFLGKK